METPAINVRPRRVRWIGSSKNDLSLFPPVVRSRVGFALWEAQAWGKAPNAKPLKGFGGAGVLEIVVNFNGDAFRVVYTVGYAENIYVLHAFKKKSKRSIGTPKEELDLIEQRIKRVEEEYEL